MPADLDDLPDPDSITQELGLEPTTRSGPRHRRPGATRPGAPRRLVLVGVAAAVLVVLAVVVAGTARTATPAAHRASATTHASTPPASPTPSPTTPGVPTLLAQGGDTPSYTQPDPSPPPTTRRPASPSARSSPSDGLPCDDYQDYACLQSWWQQ